MAGATTNLGLTLPVGSDPPSELRVSITNNANALDAYSLLTSVVTNTVSASVLRGQSVVASPSTTQTLPAVGANAMVSIVASSTVTAATPVTVAGSQIYGVGLANPASSFSLGTPGAYAVLQSDGTHWFVIAGQQDTGWVAVGITGGGVTSTGRATAARLVGDRVWLQGGLSNASGSTVFPTATMPTVMKPATDTTLTWGGLWSFAVHATGAVTMGISASSTINLDGSSYSLS